jgi:hypothetical protein
MKRKFEDFNKEEIIVLFEEYKMKNKKIIRELKEDNKKLFEKNLILENDFLEFKKDIDKSNLSYCGECGHYVESNTNYRCDICFKVDMCDGCFEDHECYLKCEECLNEKRYDKFENCDECGSSHICSKCFKKHKEETHKKFRIKLIDERDPSNIYTMKVDKLYEIGYINDKLFDKTFHKKYGKVERSLDKLDKYEFNSKIFLFGKELDNEDLIKKYDIHENSELFFKSDCV